MNLETIGIILGYVGRMENKMETIRIVGIIQGL